MSTLGGLQEPKEVIAEAREVLAKIIKWNSVDPEAVVAIGPAKEKMDK